MAREEVRVNNKKNHREHVEPGQKLVGAGLIDYKQREAVWFDSMSCEDEFGYDRPRDPSEAEKVLAEVRDAFEAWVQSE